MHSLANSLFPYPKHLKTSGEEVEIARLSQANFRLCAETGSNPREEEALRLLEQRFLDLAAIDDCRDSEKGYDITLRTDPQNPAFAGISKKEAYSIQVTRKGAVLCGADPAGTFYAAVTLGQLLWTEEDRVLLPEVDILDYPSFSRRGNYMECRYGTEFMTLSDWKAAVDYFAGMKLNQLTIGIYGCWSVQYDGRVSQYLYVPIHAYPELKTPRNIKYYSVRERRWICQRDVLPAMFREDFLGEIIAYAKRKNITVKPLFNSLGHNRLLPETFPEIAAKTESGGSSGYGFCTRNPKTYEILFRIYDEIIGRYLEPNGIDSIEIGLDEVGELYHCHCEKCRDSSYSEIMVEHIIRLCQHLKGREMKHIYIYHDMLFHQFHMVNEELRERFIQAGIYDAVVLDWWSYDDPKHLFWDEAGKVNGIFRSVIKPFTGYYNWVIPTENNANIRACAKLAAELGFEGIEAYGTFEYCYDKNYLCLAEAAWDPERAQDFSEFDQRYARFRFPRNSVAAERALDSLHGILIDETGELYLNRACYRLEYYHYSYYHKDLPFPQDFPGNAFRRIRENKEEYHSYLQLLRRNSAAALEYFEKEENPSRMNEIWRLTAQHYFVLADEYQTLTGLEGSHDPFHVLTELDRLILQRERLMALAETVRFPAVRYTYLRNMTVFWQYLRDTRDYFQRELAAGRSPVLNLMAGDTYKSTVYDFLK